MPPAAVKVAEYEAPTTPVGKLVVVIDNGAAFTVKFDCVEAVSGVGLVESVT